MPIVMLRKKSDTYDKDLQERNKIQESFEEIANTYLKTSVSSKSTPPTKKKTGFTKLPWIIASLAVVIALAIFVSNSNFDIKIRILNKSPFINKMTASDASSALSGKEMLLVKGGQVVSVLVGKGAFFGDAIAGSKISQDEIILSNSSGTGSASYRIEFKKPLNLSNHEIGYFARSVSDGTKMVLMVTDSDNRAYRVEDTEIAKLSKDWHAYSVNFKPVKGSIDLKNVSGIRFEFGASTTGNPQNISISLRDIYLAKSKRFKWL